MERGYDIKKLGRQDERLFVQLIALFHEVFETGEGSCAPQTYPGTLLAKREFVVFAAIDNGEVIGGLTAYELPAYYSEGAELYLYDIAVRSDCQGMGVGKKLLLAVQEYCRENKIKVMFVEANEEDEGAVKFYHATGGRAERVVHFNFEIR